VERGIPLTGKLGQGEREDGKENEFTIKKVEKNKDRGK
jgi:hypothetical protein